MYHHTIYHQYYTVIRYEDFALEPIYRAGVLYQWLGLIGPEVWCVFHHIDDKYDVNIKYQPIYA
jgi:hypothetical protein